VNLWPAYVQPRAGPRPAAYFLPELYDLKVVPEGEVYWVYPLP